MKRIIFAGTSEFGIPTLNQLKDKYELILIITQPDKPTGRKKELTPSPIKLWAQKNNVRVIQPEKIITAKSELINLTSDLMLVAAYGQIIAKEVLDLPKFGSINIHGSILPKYRGAAPIQYTLLNGDSQAGVSLLKMDEKMDHGPLVASQTITINDNDNFPSLYKRLADLSANLVIQTLPQYFSGELKPVEQNHGQATYTKLLTREDGKINWARPAREIHNQIRALNPEPGTWSRLGDKTVKILEAEIASDHTIDLPGKLYNRHGEPAVKCLDYALILKKVKPEGKNEMTGKDFLNGLKNLSDKIFI